MRFDHKQFFDGFKENFDDTLDQGQVDGIEFLLTSFENDMHWGDVRCIAYAFATVFHETAGSMQPVEEGYYLGRYGAARVKSFQKSLRYAPYFGRGYVQLTWKTNYIKAGKALGIDLAGEPELALEKENAFEVLTLGMFEGWFSPGNKLTKYIHGTACDYRGARRIINGTDKAALIAGYAIRFEKILKDSAAASSEEVVQPSAENEPTSAGIVAPLTADGSQPSSTEQPPTDVVVEKEEDVPFRKKIWKKLTAWFTGFGGLATAKGYQEDIAGFGIPASVIKYAIIAAVVAFAGWLVCEFAMHLWERISKRWLTTALVEANATPTNTVIVACPEDLNYYEDRGYKVIRRQ